MEIDTYGGIIDITAISWYGSSITIPSITVKIDPHPRIGDVYFQNNLKGSVCAERWYYIRSSFLKHRAPGVPARHGCCGPVRVLNGPVTMYPQSPADIHVVFACRYYDASVHWRFTTDFDDGDDDNWGWLSRYEPSGSCQVVPELWFRKAWEAIANTRKVAMILPFFRMVSQLDQPCYCSYPLTLDVPTQMNMMLLQKSSSPCETETAHWRI